MKIWNRNPICCWRRATRATTTEEGGKQTSATNCDGLKVNVPLYRRGKPRFTVKVRSGAEALPGFAGAGRAVGATGAGDPVLREVPAAAAEHLQVAYRRLSRSFASHYARDVILVPSRFGTARLNVRSYMA
ncbi:hypothetical protein KCP78_17355 [Salmonella enterica subsp. enterica]|nr:hypothetical protein KCP78_17355 [Salmonella enterica subsp. enterica]